MATRTRIVITVIAALALLGLLIPPAVTAYRAATRPPVLITIPPGVAQASPLPYGLRSASPAAPPSSDAPSASSIYIHVAGSVRRPDVYQLAAGSRVFQAIHAAGGALANADTDAVNLAEPLHDGEKVYIPAKGEGQAADSGAGNVIGHASSGGDDSAAAPVARHDARSTRSGSAAKLTSPAQGRIDINTASAAELQKLPGVGPAMAQRIVAGRRQLGRFRAPADLLDITGIGPKKYKKIAPFIKA